MKLVHPELDGQIIFSSEKMCEWVIESPADFSAYTQELFCQSEGMEGRFVLSEGEKEKDISKCVEVILNKLYCELSELAAGEELYVKTQTIKNNLLTYCLELEYFSPYILETGAELDILAVFKATGIKFSDCADDFVGRLNQYIKVMGELMRKKVIVLVNIGGYVSKEQLEDIIQNAAYNEIALLLIENMQRELKDGVYQYIIDKDRCEIF